VLELQIKNKIKKLIQLLDTIIKAEKCDKKINKQNEQQLHGC